MPVPTDITQLSQTASANSPGGSEAVGTAANDYLQAAFAFIRKLYDGGWVPNGDVSMSNHQLLNVYPGSTGTSAANINQLWSTLGAPSGTRIVFQQATAPSGWVVDTSAYLQDAAVRFNGGAGAGGSSGWGSWNFGGTYTTDGTALTVGQMPSHNHYDAGHGHTLHDPGHNHYLNDPGHAHGIPHGGASAAGTGANWTDPSYNAGGVAGTNASGTGIWLNASATGIWLDGGYANISYNGGNQAHTHTFRGPQVKYCDVVVCVKS